jgi:HD domain
VVDRVRHLAHLVARFVTSLLPRPPSAAGIARVRAILTPGELAVWEAMPRADRVEAIATLERLPPDVAADDRWAAAALLHDAGKQVSGLGTFGRTLTTLRGVIQGRDHVRGRAGAYLHHPALGARLLESAGARPEAVAWAATHHERDRWPRDVIPEPVCEALARADGET